ncbi:ParB N-terminal domain-containing protein [Bacillus toyonensis]|uniref:ParB N-terminal domain-containing protein n=1 Tax=Bacillus toyonensis TaxID=155322 RepID=UPI003D1C356A
MYNKINTLKLIPISSILLHEEHETIRLQRIQEKIIADDFITNPILTTAISPNQYLVLDGAHRAESLRKLNFQYIPVQVFDTNEFQINMWCHLIKDNHGILNSLLENPAYIVTHKPSKTNLPFVAKIRTLEKVYYVFCNTSDFHKTWKDFVSYYNSGDVIRIPDFDSITLNHNDILIEFPGIALKQIESIVNTGQVLPSGVTRILVKDRILNIKIPLKLLKNYNEIEWSKFLNKIQNKLRYYPESVYILES